MVYSYLYSLGELFDPTLKETVSVILEIWLAGVMMWESGKMFIVVCLHSCCFVICTNVVSLHTMAGT